MELWDIYTIDRKKTGRTMVRDVWNLQPGEYHITVLVLVQRPDGTFLITQRVLDKPWAGGHWEIPGGGVLAGETPEEAAKREVREETGLDVSAVPGEVIWSYRRDNPDEKDNYFVDVYRFILDFAPEDIRLQVEETAGFKIATAEEIRALGEAGIFLHYNSIKEVFKQ